MGRGVSLSRRNKNYTERWLQHHREEVAVKRKVEGGDGGRKIIVKGRSIFFGGGKKGCEPEDSILYNEGGKRR